MIPRNFTDEEKIKKGADLGLGEFIMLTKFLDWLMNMRFFDIHEVVPLYHPPEFWNGIISSCYFWSYPLTQDEVIDRILKNTTDVS